MCIMFILINENDFSVAKNEKIKLSTYIIIIYKKTVLQGIIANVTVIHWFCLAITSMLNVSRARYTRR